MLESPYKLPNTNVDHEDLEYLKKKYNVDAVMIVLGIGDTCYHRGLNFDGKRVGITSKLEEEE